eukprot:scaffold41190_cov24-Prasinocladus_malaysianus.AAC.1
MPFLPRIKRKYIVPAKSQADNGLLRSGEGNKWRGCQGEHLRGVVAGEVLGGGGKEQVAPVGPVAHGPASLDGRLVAGDHQEVLQQG